MPEDSLGQEAAEGLLNSFQPTLDKLIRHLTELKRSQTVLSSELQEETVQLLPIQDLKRIHEVVGRAPEYQRRVEVLIEQMRLISERAERLKRRTSKIARQQRQPAAKEIERQNSQVPQRMDESNEEQTMRKGTEDPQDIQESVSP
mmetsp:Transcript_12848/g.22169  ORF Transcript_12848/g.22169 Transcript_12848/m.22169 type:complete len:146 (-) Transcript_12848:608-1045(-)|eukprot:CAMPEP_0196653046 /NCGR_PEP_ID=MMETSP1086-20130531/2611_1 /TAXON_ID=77921 /ORGANISM="Cyanoptyche  gloeocystis , Strain SAG4.97" /LENGTH=145 /DNA_ID=CAMNT_0041984013 /DNA_START=140 /DNA_END=577 /DNA_ORIENTATION=+